MIINLLSLHTAQVKSIKCLVLTMKADPLQGKTVSALLGNIEKKKKICSCACEHLCIHSCVCAYFFLVCVPACVCVRVYNVFVCACVMVIHLSTYIFTSFMKGHIFLSRTVSIVVFIPTGQRRLQGISYKNAY